MTDDAPAQTNDASRGERLKRLLHDEIWPAIPPDLLGVPISEDEKDEILGYGPDRF